MTQLPQDPVIGIPPPTFVEVTAEPNGRRPARRGTLWYCTIETELLPGALRFGKWKAVWSVREDWLGPAVYTAEEPRLDDLWQDPTSGTTSW